MSHSRQTGALMRSKAREAALQYLYQLDFNLIMSYSCEEFIANIGDILSGEETASPADESGPMSANARDFALSIVKGVTANKEQIDTVISQNAENWSVARMAPVDRNVIRIATYEMLLRRKDIPARVAINEAINLAKKYGGEKSGAFVNSVLDKIRAAIEGTAE